MGQKKQRKHLTAEIAETAEMAGGDKAEEEAAKAILTTEHAEVVQTGHCLVIRVSPFVILPEAGEQGSPPRRPGQRGAILGETRKHTDEASGGGTCRRWRGQSATRDPSKLIRTTGQGRPRHRHPSCGGELLCEDLLACTSRVP